MSRRTPMTAALVLTLALAGCSTAGSSSSKFSGAQGDVAKVVSDLAQAGQRKDAQKICTQIIAQSLVRQIGAAGTTCQAEMKKAIDDADDFDLTVQRVNVHGSQATAVVKRGKTGPTATFKFVRQQGSWRATSFGG
jgi:hypothetical protein